MGYKKIGTLWILSLLLLVLSACQSANDTVLEPSKLFYVHDTKHILLNATSWSIFNHGQELYNDSKSSNIPATIQGAQVVVLAYAGDNSDFSSTEIFNHWGIGQNDMGILIILFFNEAGDSYEYNNMTFEIGIKMSEYLSAFAANDLITTYFDDPNILDFDYDARLMSLYYGVLSYIYLNVYGYQTYNHQSYMDGYYDIQYEYISAIPRHTVYDEWVTSYWFWIIVVVVVLLGGSIFQFIPMMLTGRATNFSGGGKSIGYWFRR